VRVLVTGGNGFVGRQLVRSMLGRHDVTVVDSVRYGAVRFRDDELKQFSFRNVDIRDSDAVHTTFAEAKPEVVVHLAAIHYIPECQANPGLAVETNVVGTVNLLNVCPQDTRFVFASSAAVYENSDRALHEVASPLGPNDIYGATKLQGEHYLEYFSKWRRFPAVAVRLFNVVGPGETNPHVLPEIVAQLRTGRRTLSLGNVTPKRDFIHVNDAAAGFAAIATEGSVEPGTVKVVNLGRGQSFSVRQVIDLLADVIGEEITVAVDPQRFRRADNPLLLADISRIASEFGWAPKLDLRRAAEDLWIDPELPPSLVDRYAL
jgi:UDP-glucose 4-epimerase